MTCVCELPEHGGKIYQCERLGCRMTPARCELYWTRGNYRQAWDAGTMHGQGNYETQQTKPVELPPTLTRVRNFVVAVAKFAGDGFHLTDKQEQERRVEACMACNLFVRGRCLRCGCYGRLKKLGRVWTCPEEKW